MRLVDEMLRLSATDLANHLGCVHVSQLNRGLAGGHLRKPVWNDPIGQLLRERGSEHEKAYLGHLRAATGGIVVEIPLEVGSDGVDKTLAAMRAGADIIYQAPLGNERWYGRADFLCKVDRPSPLGAWSYEVTDAKLAPARCCSCSCIPSCSPPHRVSLPSTRTSSHRTTASRRSRTGSRITRRTTGS